MKHFKRPQRRQKGIALLTVLLVLGLGVFIARDMILTTRADTSRQIRINDTLQANFYALGGEAYARALLRDDRLRDGERGIDADGKTEDWYVEKLEFSLDEGELLIRVVDMQGRFNVNSLLRDDKLDSVAFGQLQRLLNDLNMPSQLAGRVADWLDPDVEVGPGGAEDAVYLRGTTPHLTGNTAMVDVTELKSLGILNDEQFTELEPFLTSLPSGTTINLNTASSEVMEALVANPDSAGLRQLQARQGVKTWDDVDEALRNNGVANAEDLSPYLTTQSEYFQIEVIALYRDRSARLRTVVKRDNNNGNTAVIYRSRTGTLRAQ